MKEIYANFSTVELQRRTIQLEHKAKTTLAKISVEALLELNEVIDNLDELPPIIQTAVEYTHQVFAIELLRKELFRREHWQLPESDDDDDSGTTIGLCNDPVPSGGLNYNKLDLVKG